MFKLRNFTILCTKWAQNEGRGHVYHGVASPLLFKIVWRRLGIEVMSFWSLCWNLVPFLSDIGFQLLKSLWSSLMYFYHLDSSTTKPCCCNSCSMWFCIVLLKYTRHLEGSIFCSKTFIYLSAFIVPSKTCKLPIPYALMHPHTSEMLAFELNADNTLEGLPPL